MHIVSFTASHAEDAAEIVLAAYRSERQAVPALPAYDDRDGMGQMTADLAAAGLPGFAAVEGGKLLGFLAGYPVGEFFGSHDGVYVPPQGNGAAGPDRRLVIQRLYEAASAAWVGEKRLTHCVSFWAHDAEAQDAWYWLGFGLRCVDAVRPLTDVSGISNAACLDVRKAGPGDAEGLYGLHAEHCGYYRGAPLFMPHVEVEGGLEEFQRWLQADGNHLWAAWDGGRPVSYLRVGRGGGNTFATRAGESYHINGAFTAPDARGRGAAALLLQAIVDWLRGQGQERLSVDYESFNIHGSRFWRKHFTPFLHSPVRAIDDRIIK